MDVWRVWTKWQRSAHGKDCRQISPNTRHKQKSRFAESFTLLEKARRDFINVWNTKGCCCLGYRWSTPLFLLFLQFYKNWGIFAFRAMTQVQQGFRKRKNVKVTNGRGRKRSSWPSWLHREMTTEFERLLNIGVDFSSSIVMILVPNILGRRDSLYKSDYTPEDRLHGPINEKHYNFWKAKSQNCQNDVFRWFTHEWLRYWWTGCL